MTPRAPATAQRLARDALAGLGSAGACARPGLARLEARGRRFATAAPPVTPVTPVTQSAAGSKGPTAMVFLNMGGPSTTSEVGDFLSRLFVRPRRPARQGMHAPRVAANTARRHRPMAT